MYNLEKIWSVNSVTNIMQFTVLSIMFIMTFFLFLSFLQTKDWANESTAFHYFIFIDCFIIFVMVVITLQYAYYYN